MTTPQNPKRPNAPIDPLLQQRLAQLSGRRPGSALPPPTATPSSVAGRAAMPGRRAKPARTAKLSALALSAVTTLGLTAAFANQDGQTDSVQLTSGTATGSVVTVAAAAPTTVAATTASSIAETTTAAATPVVSAGGVADGTYVGASDTNRWGTVQVQVVYSGGQVTDVQILQYPDGERKSVSINQRALPTLISESLAAQSADVNTVSGATYTSKSYRISLQSAIDAAKAASGVSG